MKTLASCLCLFFVLIGTAVAASLREQGGDIFYVGDDGQSRQLTKSKNNGGAVLSPDGQKVAYLHIRPDVERDHEVFRGTEIWLLDVASGDARRVVKTRRNYDNENANLSQFNSLAFSVAGDLLYFLSEWGMQSDGLHVLDISTGKQKFIINTNIVFVVPSGRYAGYLIITERAYQEEGGATEEFWLVTPAGKEVKRAGKTWKQAMQFVQREQK